MTLFYLKPVREATTKENVSTVSNCGGVGTPYWLLLKAPGKVASILNGPVPYE